MASCVAVGCFTVKAYSDMVEKLVMMGDGGRWPRYYCRGRYVDELVASEDAKENINQSAADVNSWRASECDTAGC
jgi:hypothetical protein